MSDDVKVKFGGDFSDIAKGAGDAVSKAGASLGAWFNDFKKSTEASILSSLALSNIFSNFVKGAAETLQYFREMDLALKRFGGSGDAQFQQLAKYGKEVGVSMETVARTTNYFNKVRSEAAKGNQTYVGILKQFGFTQKEISSGNISAIEVLGRLADAYDKTGYEGLVGEKAMNAFGIRGKELTAIFKNGRESLEAFTKAMGTMNRETITKLSESQEKIERFKKSLETVFIQGPLKFLSNVQEIDTVARLIEEVDRTKFEKRGPLDKGQYRGGGTMEQQAALDAGEMVATLGESKSAIKEAIKQSKFRAKDAWFEKDTNFFNLLAENLQKKLTQLETAQIEKKPGLEIPLVKELLTSSSLQAIGGGDISSVLSGTIQANMLTAMQETAANTGKLAAGADAPKTTPSNVAK